MEIVADDLILFARVVDAGSFSQAAERCGLPKSTVSRRIGALERALGERLLTRTTRHFAITEFGEQMLEHARRLLDEAEAAGALAQHRQATPQGTLRVSLPPDFLQELELLPFLLAFATRYPEVKVEMDLSPRRVDLVAERFDLAIRVAARLPDDATLVARRLLEMRHGLYASPAYLARFGRPLAPADLASHTGLKLITSSGETQPWQLSRGDERWAGTPSGPIAVNSVGLQRELAAHGLGLVGLSERHASAFVQKGLLERVLPEWCLPTMTVWAVTPGRRLQPTRVTAFVEMLREALEA
ncbi:LysR family transcriptional regulator [Burkholderiaceae bacterium FT117]|uniref:LysR family transcriptional regulator n=1 Tax=Zeimonas sediminis TaxID=2944268 RepID=UPI002342D3E2|nr:LysR family transcriptional regulator [Zeimonas sediminis]MCM5569451.1 LysR family transcriptional regulator [Zeimonas sediminis]